MIDPTAFTEEMTILRDRFGRRDMTPETIARYLDYLDPIMTTAEFRAAAREIFNHDTWWPSPQRFLDAIRGEPRLIAEASWERMIAGARQGQRPTISDAESEALKAIGGFVAIERCESDYRLREMRKDYERALAQRLQPTAPQLAPARLDIDGPA